jgi:SAM-dependent methyltransferase
VLHQQNVSTSSLSKDQKVGIIRGAWTTKMAKRCWRRLMTFAFHLLYNPFAWAYDGVSWAVSRGEWQRWQGAVLPYLTGRRVLEIGFGTGNLLVDMATRGYQPWGVDLSPTMAAIAAGKLRTHGTSARLCRARAQALPFCDGAFDSIALTFPAGFIGEAETHREMERVLKPRGRVVIADGGYLLGRDPLSRFLNWALGLTGGPAVSPAPVEEGDFLFEQQEVRFERSTGQVIVAHKRS